MSRYEERLQKDIANLKERLAHLARAVENGFEEAIRAFLASDEELAAQVILADHPINRASRELDRLCHSFIAVHLPSAGHLRYVSTVMRANIELERIGDYAVTISREAVQLSHRPEGLLAEEIEQMAVQAQQMLKEANAAFDSGDADRAKGAMGTAYQVRHTYDAVFADIVIQSEKASEKDLFAYHRVLNMIMRVGDQAKNICEETVFATTGETKEAKIYRILFLDEDNSTLAPMAQAVARKSFPGSGQYDSAGRRAAPELDADLASFLTERGMAVDDLAPKNLNLDHQALADYHVIVSMQGAVKSYVDPVPFQTVALEWELEEADKDYQEAYREIAHRVRELMMSLRGEEAP
ncbi:MAG: phosphate signaling complex protein PhoU [Candidatus Latescibacteria bacterium]|nr:phosphate signaling complex protein PhoU [Candidatus Latescibacterota bacterium]